MKIRANGTKEMIPVQIIDKEVIEFLRSKLVYTVNPPDFDFDKTQENEYEFLKEKKPMFSIK